MRIKGDHTERNKALSPKKWVTRLDDFANAKVKEKAGYRCEHCGNLGIQLGGSRTMHWAHIAGRGKKETRWGIYINGEYFWNAVCLCGGCHLWLDNAENRLETQDWLEEKFGRHTMTALREEARKTKTWHISDYEAKWKELNGA